MYEQTFSTEIFRVAKFILREPLTVYELSELNNCLIECQFYSYELVKVAVLHQTEFHIDKTVRTRNKNGIKQHRVKLRAYDANLNTRVNCSDIKKI